MLTKTCRVCPGRAVADLIRRGCRISDRNAVRNDEVGASLEGFGAADGLSRQPGRQKFIDVNGSRFLVPVSGEERSSALR